MLDQGEVRTRNLSVLKGVCCVDCEGKMLILMGMVLVDFAKAIALLSFCWLGLAIARRL